MHMQKNPVPFGHAVLKDELPRMITLFDLVLGHQLRPRGFEVLQAYWSLALTYSVSLALRALGPLL